nr:hypothetical protein [Frigoriglobus tundricola]
MLELLSEISLEPSGPAGPAGSGGATVTASSCSARAIAFLGRLSARVLRHAWSTRACVSVNPAGFSSSIHSVPNGAAAVGSRFSSWNQIMPSAWTSSVGAGGSFFTCCGHAYRAVAAPRAASRCCSPRGPVLASSSPRTLSICPHPKSVTHMVNLPPSVGCKSTLLGFRSRWTMPRACALAMMVASRRMSLSAASGLAASYRHRQSNMRPARSYPLTNGVSRHGGSVCGYTDRSGSTPVTSFSSNTRVNSSVPAVIRSRDSASVMNFSAAGDRAGWVSSSARHTSELWPNPRSSVRVQSSSPGRSPGRNRGARGGRNAAKSSGLWMMKASGTVWPSGSDGRRSTWRTATGRARRYAASSALGTACVVPSSAISSPMRRSNSVASTAAQSARAARRSAPGSFLWA